jgi:glycosyltransferase involved in cell wall biosynthesis
MNTLHILGSAKSPVTIFNRIDPFSIAAIKFIENMTQRGWCCIHYGIAGCETPCETVICLDDVTQDVDVKISEYSRRCGEAISARKQPGDLIMCFHGWENRVAAEANRDLTAIEPSIGYDTKAVWAPYRVFTSYAQMHMYYGQNDMLMSPSWFDSVIPNAFTPGEFTFNDRKDNYVLYFGRVIESKGIHIAVQATERSGHRLIIAGPGDLGHLGYHQTPDHVTCVGLCDADQRRELMSRARAIIGPTYYVEPFGNMVAEGYFSGTPAITTDWGGFTETVVQGETGFRCREMREFVAALNRVDEIDPHRCRKWAMANYAEDVVHDQFDLYFKRVQENNFYRS